MGIQFATRGQMVGGKEYSVELIQIIVLSNRE